MYQWGQEYARRRRQKVQEIAMDNQTREWSDARRRRARSDEGVERTPQGPRQLPSRVPPKKMPRMNATNAQVNKTSMVMKGKRKLKRKKNIKVSKALTQKVKKVMEGQQATGSYTKVWGGFVGSVLNTPSATNSAPNARVVATTAGINNLPQTCIVGPSVNEPAGSRTLWNALSYWQPAAGYTASSEIIPYTNMDFFTIEKIIDAASVCFNRKAIALNPTVITDNLATVFNPASGLPVTGQIGSLKINLVNSWVEFTLRNLSARIVHLDIFECTPRLKFQDNSALDSLGAALENGGQNIQDAELAQDATFRYFNRLATSSVHGYIQGLLTEGTVDAFGIAKQFGWNFNVVKRQMTLAPFETCIHSIKGPTGMFDWSKFSVNEVDKVGLLKGASVSCFFAVRGDMALPSTRATSNKLADTAPVPGTANTYSAQMSMPIAVEIKESFSMKVPEVAGFVAAVAGSRQQLNMRKKKIVYANFLENNGTTAFTMANEQQPFQQAVSTGTIQL